MEIKLQLPTFVDKSSKKIQNRNLRDYFLRNSNVTDHSKMYYGGTIDMIMELLCMLHILYITDSKDGLILKTFDK